MTSVSPVTGTVLGTFPCQGHSSVRAVVRRARTGQQAWARLPLRHRREALRRFRDALAARADALVDVLVSELGMPRQEALAFELAPALEMITYCLSDGEAVLAPRELIPRLFRHRRVRLQWTPRGVIGVLSGWTDPFAFLVSMAAPALLTGSSVVLKPSSSATLSALALRRLWTELDLPDDVLTVVTGDERTGRRLLDAELDMVEMAGGAEAAQKIAARCTERQLPCVTVSHHKAPLLVCSDASIQPTARAVMHGGFCGAGQRRGSVGCVLAHRHVHDALVEQLVSGAQALRAGNPELQWVERGVLVRAQRAPALHAAIEEAVEQGAVRRTKASLDATTPAMFPPTVLSGCAPSMRVVREPLLGPVLPVVQVDSEEQAVEIANGIAPWPTAYVFAASRKRAEAVATKLQAETVLINDVLTLGLMAEASASAGRVPGGGYLQGAEALRQVCRLQQINAERVAVLRSSPLGYPYSPERFRLLLKALRALYASGGVLRKLGDLL